jgi:hypothetical protein
MPSLTKPPVAEKREECEFSAWLKKTGFVRVDSFTVKLGEIYVLKPRSEQPWWTVQKRSGGERVRYFVDFPKECPVHAIIAFVEAI